VRNYLTDLEHQAVDMVMSRLVVRLSLRKALRVAGTGWENYSWWP